jgi:uncharacterized phage protein (TIGR02220 family)
MAKELPYFKFFCSEWSDGDITLESFESQGLFINICSYYWSNSCKITLTKLKKKFKGFDSLIEELVESGIIKVENDNVLINFLNEQLTEREDSSIKKSLAGKASAEARKLSKLEQQVNTSSTESQHVLNSCSTESQLIRKDKIKEYKEKDDNLSVNWEGLLSQFNNITGKNFKVICDKTKRQVNARLKEGYSKLDLVNAITNCFNDDYHKENPKYLTLEFISRADKMQKYAQEVKKPKPKQQDRL